MLIVFTSASLALVTVLAFVAGMDVAYVEWIVPLGPTASCAAILAAYAHRLGFRRATETAECILAVVIITPTALLAAYLAIYANLPLADDLLMRWNTELGFDWLHFIHSVDQHPALVTALTEAYSSFTLQLFCVPVSLCLFGQGLRARRMLLSFVFVCLASSAISVFFPAVGSFGTYQPTGLLHVDPSQANHFLTQFEAARTSPAFVLRPAEAEGILTFPSVHAALATLATWAAWTVLPMRAVVLPLNVLMIVSTLTNANHYLADLLAGAAVAVAGILLSGRADLSRALFTVRQQQSAQVKPGVSGSAG